jgi:hypothetical protein
MFCSIFWTPSNWQWTFLAFSFPQIYKLHANCWRAKKKLTFMTCNSFRNISFSVRNASVKGKPGYRFESWRDSLLESFRERLLEFFLERSRFSSDSCTLSSSFSRVYGLRSFSIAFSFFCTAQQNCFLSVVFQGQTNIMKGSWNVRLEKNWQPPSFTKRSILIILKTKEKRIDDWLHNYVMKTTWREWHNQSTNNNVWKDRNPRK